MEHSDRGQYVTDQVSTWICNDSDHIESARTMARQAMNREPNRYSFRDLQAHLTGIIRSARPHSSPWHVAQERVDWQAVADNLIPEED